MRELERRLRAQLSPAFPLDERRKLPLAFLWRRLRHVAMRDRSDVVDELGRDPIAAERVLPLLDFLYEKYFRVEVQGIEHLPASGRALVVANHSGTLPYDAAMLMHAVRKATHGRRELRPLIEDFIFHFPWLGTFLNRIGGGAPVRRTPSGLLVKDEASPCIPRVGPREIGKLYSERYQLQRFGRGASSSSRSAPARRSSPAPYVGAEGSSRCLGQGHVPRSSLGPLHPITPTFPGSARSDSCR